MTDIEVRFADNSDDRRISDVQLLSRASVKRESRVRPTKTLTRSHCLSAAGSDVAAASGAVLPDTAAVAVVSQMNRYRCDH